MIGTNGDLEQMQRVLDREIMRLQELSVNARGRRWVSRQLQAVCCQRVAVSTALTNRRVEAANKVVDFRRWFNGNGALQSRPRGRRRCLPDIVL